MDFKSSALRSADVFIYTGRGSVVPYLSFFSHHLILEGASLYGRESKRKESKNLDDPVVTVHQSIGEAKEQFYYERTVFLRCVANSNPPVRYSWRRGQEVLLQGSDKGVEIYEPFFTQGETKILKLKNLRPQDYANYSCIASVRNVCNIPDKMVSFRLSNKTGELYSI
ncbi:hypothetical protein CB1_001244004 [Camelus ferus]|nr:hypothetical protein CB1_001244004 [Camelus ferus]